jgi:DNA-binding MarR family transcriptional regulator
MAPVRECKACRDHPQNVIEVSPMLTSSSSNVVPLRKSEPETKRPPFGKVFCSDWLHSIAAQVTHAEFHALFMLTRHANDQNGTTKVSAQEIGRAIGGMNKAYTQDVLRGLAEKGLISREGGGKGPGNAAIYTLEADAQEVAAFHDDLRKRRAERRAAWKPDTTQLADMLIADVGRAVAEQFRDSFEGDIDAAVAVLVKIKNWPKKARVAYIDQILERRHSL